MASGIKTVVYIEPYPKSYATQLQSDAIIVTADRSENKKVIFSPFIGISPYRYKDIFERSKRKDERGDFIEWISAKPKPIVNYTLASWLKNETAVIDIMDSAARKLIEDGIITLRNGE